MTKHYLALEGASFVLPDGRTLFSELDAVFDQVPTGLVGRNGVGKTILARLLAGELEPAAGRCVRSANVYYLPQQIGYPEHASVATLAGVESTLAALQRIEDGSTNPADFELVGAKWDLRQCLRNELAASGLGHLAPATPAHTLSGGEAMRVALLGASLADADFLILDEPGNHLDHASLLALIAQLQSWTKGLLVISHDRFLLSHMRRIVELSPLGLHSYGGNYAFYEECKTQEQQAALRLLEQRKLERRRAELSAREQQQRQERRQARGRRQSLAANQSKLLLNLKKERSEGTSGKLRQLHGELRERLTENITKAAHLVEEQASITLHALPPARGQQRRILTLDKVELPFVAPALRHISLTLTGQQRLGIVGPNGCGKSTLLKVLAGHHRPLAGRRVAAVGCAYLDQQLAGLAPHRSILAQLLAANSVAGEACLRTWLAQLDLDARKISMPSGALSGGERLKGALACALYADPPVQLLLLDEPGNHLDLVSLAALEAMLNQYTGAMLVVSHDAVFLDRIGLTGRLLATPEGWRLEPS
jgi:ATPase subunit of ABC transporter with duplicated ATPase domains